MRPLIRKYLVDRIDCVNHFVIGYFYQGVLRVDPGLSSLFLIVFLLSCTSATEVTTTEPLSQIAAKTLIAGNTLEKMSAKARLSSKIIIPRKLFQLYHVSRPRAELRVGPGPQFSILPKILEQGTLLIQIGHHGKWKKIIVPQENLTGWIHSKLMEPDQSQASPLTIPLQALPTVFSTKRRTRAFAYDTNKSITLKIPKGSVFHMISQDQHRVLAILESTQSVIWLSKKDVL